jgi:hypothetical protein
MTDPKPPVTEIGIVCAQVDGQWHVTGILPPIELLECGEVAGAGLYIDILTTAIKWLAAKYLIKLPVESGVVH